jgi:hypothetical protein
MKQLILILSMIFIISSCGDQENRPNRWKKKSNDPIIEADSKKDDEEENEEPAITFSKFHGFTVGNGVRVREEDRANSAKVAELENGTLLTIVGETERKTLSTKTECDRNGYPWFNVVTSVGHKGWIYGKYVYKLAKKSSKGVNGYIGTTYKFDEEPFIFGVGKDQSMPVADDVGLTGCNDYLMPFFYKEGEGKIYPILAKKRENVAYQLANHSNNYWLLEESDGRSDNINRVLPILYGVRMSFNVSYQEGSGSGEIDVMRRNKRFYAQIKNYKHQDEPE